MDSLRQRARVLQQGLRGQLPQGRRELREGAGRRSQVQPGGACIWAGRTTRCSTSRRRRSTSGGPSRSIPTTWRRAPASPGCCWTSGDTDEAIRQLTVVDAARSARTRWPVSAGAGVPDEGQYPQSIEARAAAIRLNAQQSGGAFLAGREPAAERRLRRSRRPSTSSICV